MAGFQENATAPTSASVIPAAPRQYCSDAPGQPAWCLTRAKRSSAHAATIPFSSMSAAAASFAKCNPRMYIRASLSAPRQRGKETEERMREVDVVVVGAGIAGSAAGYEVARRGRSCVVCERAAGPGTEATGAAAGLLSVQHEPPGTPLFDLCTAAYARWETRLRPLQE